MDHLWTKYKFQFMILDGKNNILNGYILNGTSE